MTRFTHIRAWLSFAPFPHPLIPTTSSSGQMSPPKPVISCKIPSIHDETLLQCQIYEPGTPVSPMQAFDAAAVIAHPYAPLGGSMNDAVVRLITTELLTRGYTVCLFDFRGAGHSAGRTSWSGKAELSDFTSVIQFFIQYLCFLKAGVVSSGSSPALRLVIGGYSYGSLIASHLPPGEQIISLYSDEQQNPAAKRIREISNDLAKERTRSIPSAIPLQTPCIEWSYLLISPLLPPVTYALTLGSGSTLRSSSSEDFKILINHRSLAVFGDKDAFTSVGKLRKWAEDLAEKSNGNFTYHELPGGHFWNDAQAAIGLQEAIKNWLP